MTHLVTNYYADSTIVCCVVGLWVEEWRLQDGCREVDAVEEWVVECVNSLWCASHLGLVNRLMPVFAEHGCTRLLNDADIVLYQVLAFANVNKLLHVLPLVGITHIDIHSVQFLQCFSLGRIAHPCVLLQTIFECLLQVFNQTDHTLFARLREVLLSIQFAYGLAQVAADYANSALPSGLLLLYTCNNLVGLELTIAEFVRKKSAKGLDYMQFHIRLQVFQAGVGQDVLYLVQRSNLADVHLVDILWHAHSVAITCPVDALKVLQQLFPRHDVDGSHRITAFYLIQGLHADGVLDGPFGFHLLLGFFIAVTYHLKEVLIQCLDGVYSCLLLFVGFCIILLCQRCTTMTTSNHILR